ncbi:MAG: hypothetical protein J1E28_04505 [Helicobacter sp.]|uniref:hypothetical protein n=1 Tax=Helicobacter sp. TaxID=218 RepID=UPI0025C54A61|nr:hypothetical protein [Helicobacter sp.]MCH5313642.1 hypothetical protein [Helicobacter sp.]
MGRNLVEIETKFLLQEIFSILPCIILNTSEEILWDNGVILHRPLKHSCYES